MGNVKIKTASEIQAEKEQSAIKKEIRENQKFLDDTDWYVVRQSETETPVPEDVATARANARVIINNLRQNLNENE